jgi:hypothetical protein
MGLAGSNEHAIKLLTTRDGDFEVLSPGGVVDDDPRGPAMLHPTTHGRGAGGGEQGRKGGGERRKGGGTTNGEKGE